MTDFTEQIQSIFNLNQDLLFDYLIYSDILNLSLNFKKYFFEDNDFSQKEIQ